MLKYDNYICTIKMHIAASLKNVSFFVSVNGWSIEGIVLVGFLKPALKIVPVSVEVFHSQYMRIW